MVLVSLSPKQIYEDQVKLKQEREGEVEKRIK